MIIIAMVTSIVVYTLLIRMYQSSYVGVQFESVNATGISGEVTVQHVALVASGINCYWTQINVGTIGNEFVCEGGIRVYSESNVTQVFMTVFDGGQGSTIASRDLPDGNCAIRLERSTEDLKTWSMYVNSELFYSYKYSKIWVGSPNSMLETRSDFQTGQAGIQICSWVNLRQRIDTWENATCKGISGSGDINAKATITGTASYVVHVAK